MTGRKDSTTPSPPPSLLSNKLYQATPSKSSKQEKERKEEKQLKLLTDMVQALAQKLKKRDIQKQRLQAKVDKVVEFTLQLKGAEERIGDAAAENQTLSRNIKTYRPPSTWNT